MIGDKFIVKFESILDKVYRPLNVIQLRANKVYYSKGLRISGIVKIRNRGKIEIGEDVLITSRKSGNPVGGMQGTYLYVGREANLKIGNKVGVSNSVIFCMESITIMPKVLIGGGVQIYDSDFHSLNPIIRVSGNDNSVKTAPVVIGTSAFLGAASIILKGVTIGSNSIIGAGSVVSKNVPPNEIWAGNPAKKIGVVTI